MPLTSSTSSCNTSTQTSKETCTIGTQTDMNEKEELPFSMVKPFEISKDTESLLDIIGKKEFSLFSRTCKTFTLSK